MIKAISLLFILVSAFMGCALNRVESHRPVQWATMIRSWGVANLYKVADYLYQSEQPTEEGMKNLERVGTFYSF